MNIRSVRFTSRNDFNTWHNSEKLRLGYPIIGVRHSDGVPQPNKQQTINITVYVNGRANVDIDRFDIGNRTHRVPDIDFS